MAWLFKNFGLKIKWTTWKTFELGSLAGR